MPLSAQTTTQKPPKKGDTIIGPGLSPRVGGEQADLMVADEEGDVTENDEVPM